MALSKQIHLYGVDTGHFYFQNEQKYADRISACRIRKSKLLKEKNDLKKKENTLKKNGISEHSIEACIEYYEIHNNYIDEQIKMLNKQTKKMKNKLKYLIGKNMSKIRTLNESRLKDTHIISVFDSATSRTAGFKINELTEDMFIVQTYFYGVAESLIKNNFLYKGNEYCLLTASAGQIRLKKFVMIKKSLMDEISDSLTCGLSVEKINLLGGVNPNKYLAYLALQNSATDLWEDFDIDKSIVVDDFETLVRGKVDFIEHNTFNIESGKIMDVEVPHMDGAGIYLGKKNKMVRLPWIKGLLVKVPYIDFILDNLSEYPNCSKVNDIYGKEYDIIDDDIQIIFTKSQFKMWKYYSSWDEYKDNFKKHNCQAGYCNEEVLDPNFSRLNYQFLQSITDFTDEELKKITQKTVDSIKKIGSDNGTMLKILGASKTNTNKTPLQECLSLYPEMMQDVYTREMLKNKKQKLVKEAKSGKLFINGHYTFVVPDVYAFMEWLFLKIENPKGLLEDGEVSCSLYKNSKELDIMRSPSLYREHAVRNNVYDKNKAKYLCTTACYVSVHDLISKILQFDVDGDTLQVIADETFVNMAKRNMECINPLYYDMKKAESEIIDVDTLYNGLELSFSSKGIGGFSNDISKCWDSDEVNLDVIKILCCQNNFAIDYAKTLYMPEVSEEIDNLIKRFTNRKLPYHFKYAKDKSDNQVEKLNNKTIMGRINKIIPKDYLAFSKMGYETFDYKMLMDDKNILINKNVSNLYNEMNQKVRITAMYKTNIIDDEDDLILHMSKTYQDIRKEILSLPIKDSKIIDMLVAYSYGSNKKNKLTLWMCFGEEILENLQSNISNNENYQNTICCDRCGERVFKKSNRTRYCDKCQKEVQLEHQRKSMKKLRTL